MVLSNVRRKEVYDHGKDIAKFHQICEDFKNSLRKDPNIQHDYTVTSVSKVVCVPASNSTQTEAFTHEFMLLSIYTGSALNSL